MGIFQDVVEKFRELAAALWEELGVFGHAAAANIAHDVQVLGGEAEKLLADDIAAVWDMVKQATVSVFQDPQFEELAFSGKIDKAVEMLAETVWSNVRPALPGIAQTTLRTLAQAAGSMIMAGILSL
jgi:hypothetical protein